MSHPTTGPLGGPDARDLAAAAFDALPTSVCLLNERGEVVTVNAVWRGFGAEAGPNPANYEGARYLEVCDLAAAAGDADAQRFAAGLRAVLNGDQDRYTLEYPCPAPNGVRWFVGRVSAYRARGRRWILVLHDDVTDLKLTEAALAAANADLERRVEQRAEELRLSEQRHEIVARASHEGLFDWSAGKPAYFSGRFLEILGADAPEDGGFWWLMRVHADDANRVCTVLSHPFAVGGPISFECRLRRGDGTYAWCDVRGYAIHDARSGRVQRVVGAIADITHQKKAEAALLAGATRDGLTGLPNRAVFMDRLGQALAHHRANGQGAFALLLIDLDQFGALNRHYGGDTGDAVLLEVARRIVAVAPPNTVARLGGDEFGVLVEQRDGGHTAEALAARVERDIGRPFPIGDTAYRLTASIGIVHVSALAGYDDASAMLADADLAMLAAREQGGGRWEVFEPTHRAQARRSFEMADAMRDAVDGRDQPEGFSLAYQPVVDLATGRVAGFEALMRWTHPRLGGVSPADFIPVAESTGLIIPLGAWAIRQGCARLSRWQRGVPAASAPFVSVNVSARQLYEPGFEQIVRAALADSGAQARGLKLEVTESAILDNALRAATVLSALQDLGVRIAIDDFGTGFSCLGYLSRFRFDDLKIDASFVRDMTGNERAMAVVRTIVELGRGLDMSVIAEGAENLGEVRALGRIGCPLIQGYFFGRPLALADAERMLRRGVVENWVPGLAA